MFDLPGGGIRFILIAGIILSVCFSIGCGKRETKSPAVAEKKEAAVPETTPKPVHEIDKSYIEDQLSHSKDFWKAVDELKRAVPVDTAELRSVLLKRKGELLVTRKNVLRATNLTLTEKDSILKPIDKESVDISQALVAWSNN